MGFKSVAEILVFATMSDLKVKNVYGYHKHTSSHAFTLLTHGTVYMRLYCDREKKIHLEIRKSLHA
jgi:hypothetical protein